MVCQLPGVSSPRGPEQPRGNATLTALFLKRSAYPHIRFANLENTRSFVKSGNRELCRIWSTILNCRYPSCQSKRRYSRLSASTEMYRGSPIERRDVRQYDSAPSTSSFR